MLIQFTVKSVYGADKKYPHNADAKMICELLNQKTLTDSDIAKLEKGGVVCERVAV